MKAASLKDIKNELENQPHHALLSLCLKLTRFKKENKELDIAFAEVNIKNLYIAKKNLRKILRAINRYTRYSGIKTTEVSLLIYFCRKINGSGLRINKSAALFKMYTSQLKKIQAAIDTLHEDLQFDYRKELAAI